MTRGPGTCSLNLALGSRDMPFYALPAPLPGTRKKITPLRQFASVPMRRWEASGKALRLQGLRRCRDESALIRTQKKRARRFFNPQDFRQNSQGLARGPARSAADAPRSGCTRSAKPTLRASSKTLPQPADTPDTKKRARRFFNPQALKVGGDLLSHMVSQYHRRG